jgi:Tfp pilus assembly protein PilV
MKNFILKKEEKGFTIVESLVAIGMLLLAVTGAYGVAQQSLQHSQVAREQITAFYLAQEGIEAVKNLRDENFLNGSYVWDGGATGSNISNCLGENCLVDPLVERLELCSSNTATGCLLEQNNNGNSTFYGMYSHYDSNVPIYGASSWTGDDGGSNWQPSPFTRTVTLTRTSPDEISVTVKVSWFDKVRNENTNITLREILLNWYPL